MEVTRFSHRKREYDRIHKEAAALLDWTYRTVSPSYLHLFRDKDLV